MGGAVANPAKRWLIIGTLPKGCQWVERCIKRLRRALEFEVRRVRGEVTLVDESHITTACRCEGAALLMQRYLRINEEAAAVTDNTVSAVSKTEVTSHQGSGASRVVTHVEGLTWDQKRLAVNDIVRYSQQRDAAITRLDIGGNSADIIATLYSRPTEGSDS